MPTYDVTVGGIDYEVDAPDEATAWQYANYTHQAQGTGRPVNNEQRAEPSASRQVLEATAPIIRGTTLPLAALGAGGLLAATVGAPVAVGAGAVATATMLADPIVAGVNKLFGTRLASPTEAWSHLMDEIGVPASSTEGAKLLEAISAGGVSALTMGGAGKLLQQLASPRARAIGSALSSNIGQQVVAGMGAGAGSEITRSAVEEAGGGEVAQLVGGLAGGLIGGVGGAKLGAPRSLAAAAPRVPGMTPAEVSSTIAAAEAEGKTVMTSDVYQPQTKWQKLRQEFGEGTLLGTASQRAKQQQDRINTVAEILSPYGASADADVINDVMASLGRTRSDNLTNWTNQKNAIIGRVSSAMPAMDAASLRSTFDAIDDEAMRMAGINRSHYAPAIAKLSDLKNALLGDPILDPATSAVIGYRGKPLNQIEPNLRVIGASMAKDPSLAHIKTEFEKVARNVRKALRSDVYDYIKAAEGPAVAREWGKANEEIYSMIKETESAAFSSVLRRGTANPEIVANLLKSTKPSDVRILVNNLDAAGRENAKTALLSMVAKEATLKDDTISIPKFISGVQKYSKQMGVIFEPSEVETIKGKVQYLNLTQRAGAYNDNPQTGAKLAMPLFMGMIGSAAGGVTKTAAAIGGVGLAARAYESPTTRRLLMKLPSLAVNSPEELALAKRITESLHSDYVNQVADQTKNQQLTFLPATTQQEKVGQGFSATDAQTGYRMLSKDGKKIGLYGPDNKRIGIFSSQEDARRKAEKEFRKRK